MPEEGKTMKLEPMLSCVLGWSMALAGHAVPREKVPETYLIVHAAKGDPDNQLTFEPVDMDMTMSEDGDNSDDVAVELPVDMARETEMALAKAESVYKAAIGQGKDVRVAEQLIEKAWFYYSLTDYQTAIQLSAEVQRMLMMDT